MKYIKLFEKYKYLPKNIENELYNEYKDIILNTFLNIKLEYDDIIELIKCNKNNYLCFLHNYNMFQLYMTIKHKDILKSYSTPEKMNSFHNIFNKVYYMNKNKINKFFENSIINYFKNNKEEYIEINKNYNINDIFSNNIIKKLRFILISKKFNL